MELDVAPQQRQRRWTVAIRGLLALPAYLGVLGCGLVVLVSWPIAWVVALVRGELPSWARQLYSGYLLSSARLWSYTAFLHDEIPELSWHETSGSPIQLELPAPSRLNRWSVLLRWVLALPATIIAGVGILGLTVFSVVVWGWALILGRAPETHRQAAIGLVRYYLRALAYTHLLTSRWPSPRWLFGDNGTINGRLVLSAGARVLVITYVLVGVAYYSLVGYLETRALAAVGAASVAAGSASIASRSVPGANTLLVQPLDPSDPELITAYDRALTARIPDSTRAACTPTAVSDLRVGEASGRDCYIGKNPDAPDWLQYRSYRSVWALQTSFCQLKVELGSQPCTDPLDDKTIFHGFRTVGAQRSNTLAWMDVPQGILITLDSTRMSPQQLAQYQDSHEFLAH